jgi:hypothetical protein
MSKPMPDSKHVRWDETLGTDVEKESELKSTGLPGDQPAANDADGWQQYRRWISKAPAPQGRRSGIDPSLYSWKGYREWTDQVRRNWAKDPGNDNK